MDLVEQNGILIDVSGKKLHLKEALPKTDKGHTIDEHLASAIAMAYEQVCTAELIKDEHPEFSDDEVWDLAGRARDMMDDYHIAESEAINAVISEREDGRSL